jgi:YHS domain-containing protein
MTKDPICGMEVLEKRARHMIHFEHVTFYFCSEQCKKSYAKQVGISKPTSKKGAFGRFLKKVAKVTEESCDGKPPKCH